MVKIRSSSLQAQRLQKNPPNSESVILMDILCIFHHTSCSLLKIYCGQVYVILMDILCIFHHISCFQLKIYCGKVYVFMHTVHISYKTSCVDFSIICI